MVYRRVFVFGVAFILLASLRFSTSAPAQSGKRLDPPPKPAPLGAVRFADTGYTKYGEWSTDVSVNKGLWQPGGFVQVRATLLVSGEHLAALLRDGIKVEAFCVLATAERTFDASGHIRLSSDEKMSTLLTPTGLGIEGGVQGAVTNRFGYGFRTPFDEFQTRPVDPGSAPLSMQQADFSLHATLPVDLPPGIYRVRLDYGVVAKKRNYSLNGETFAYRPFFSGRPTESHVYSPPIPASGRHASGSEVDATTIEPRIPWTLLANYNSNGYKGVVADEDKPNFALSGRNIIPDEVVLPLYDDSNKNKLSYSLEPQFPADTIEARSNIPWNFSKGELSIVVSGPLGTNDLGTAPFVGASGQWPSTRYVQFTSWKPAAYGRYTVKATGWIADIWGNRYQGGGTYHFWIAKRMTMATATFQGFSYPVGSRYGRDIGFAPPVPADVEVDAVLYPNSDTDDARGVTYSGKATAAGLFGAAQGMIPLPLDTPGEYHAQVLARYWDKDGHLWVCAMRHAGVVYPEDSPIVARGKKLTISGKYVDRGETKFEGWVDTANSINHLAHINYPYQAGDVLLIASEQQGANKIEPVLTFESKDKPAPYDSRLQGIGVTNVRLQTSNGYSPHMFPEYITDWCYYYAGAPRPGFMSRFLVGEDGVRAPYWPTSPNSFGGQINASNNGDLPGDIYRLIGGVVIRKKGAAPVYAGYLSSAFLLPRGTNNNRVISAGSEDLIGANGQKARFFLVGTRPGMTYETGTAFAPAVQIDPILPATVKFLLTFPDGRQEVAQGVADKFGTFVGSKKWILDVPGVYRFQLEADWQGFKGYMPGLPAAGGDLYVIEKDRPANAAGIKLNFTSPTTFNAAMQVSLSGSSTAKEIHYAAVIPGAAVDQGSVPVIAGRFEYILNPALINNSTPTYDILNMVTGRPEIGDVVHLTFFSKEVTPEGAGYHSFTRVIIRGTKIMYAR